MPGLGRASTTWRTFGRTETKDVDGRDKPGHDMGGRLGSCRKGTANPCPQIVGGMTKAHAISAAALTIR
jgi:hypothetical protein